MAPVARMNQWAHESMPMGCVGPGAEKEIETREGVPQVMVACSCSKGGGLQQTITGGGGRETEKENRKELKIKNRGGRWTIVPEFQCGAETPRLLVEPRAARKLLCGGGWHGHPAKEEGGGFQEWASVPGLLLCVRTNVATKGTGIQNFGPEKKILRKKVPPHMCSQNDQRDVGIILSLVCWGRTPAPRPST